MHTVEISGYKTVKYASCIEELSEEEFLHLISLYSMQQAGKIDINEFRIMLTMKLLNIRKTLKYYKMPQSLRAIVHDNINRLVDTIDTFYDDIEEDGRLIKKLRLTWIKQMLPTIGNLVGPADALTNCSVFEYKEALNYYLDYVKTQNDESLSLMIAVLYRPRKWLYTIRKKLSFNTIEERESFTPRTNSDKLHLRARRISKLPEPVKTAVFIWFANCLDFIVTGKPVVDGIEIDFSLLFSKPADDSAPSGIGITGIIYSLAESSVFGNADKTSNTNLYDILVRLYQLKTDHDAMIAKSKKSNDKD